MLIGLTGATGAGKDSTALVLAAAGWRSIALADALRVEITAAWHIDQRLLTDRAHKEQPMPQLCAGNTQNEDWQRWAEAAGHSLAQPRSPRWVMQQWGSFRREADALHWVRQVAYWVQYQSEHGHKNLVITDVRQANEAEALIGLGGYIVRVHRAGMAPLPADTADHESETHPQLVADADIHNGGDFADLAHETWRVVRALAVARRPAHQVPAGTDGGAP